MAHASELDPASRRRTALRTGLHPAVLAAATLFAAAAVLAPAREARADDTGTMFKGIAGGATLGADAVTIIESLVGVRAGWAYWVGAVVGAGGGAAGGYFVAKDSTDGKAPTYMLAGGLALIIPAIVLSLNATRYLPEEGATEDRAPIGPEAEPGAPGGSVTGAPPGAAPPPAQPETPPQGTRPQSRLEPASPQPLPMSLLDMGEGSLRLGVPLPDVRPVFTPAEQRQYGLRAEAELRLPVLHAVF